MATRQIGNYRIVEYIGSGGFGSVYKAEDIGAPGRIVAIKELHKKHTKSGVMKQRFFQEALAMARLDHPNIPRLYTFGEEAGSYYLVMEFVQGVSLGEEIAQSGGIPEERAVPIICQVLEAVGYGHKNGVIHRDLKPDNILLVRDGDSIAVKVLDFGIAKLVGGENLTMTGEGFGTPSYMSPERIAGIATLDGRADIYSIGIILYEMLTGTVPFQSTHSDPVLYWIEMRRQHETDPVPGLSSYQVSPAIEAVVGRAAAKKAEERFATADEMLQALQGDSCQAALQITTQPAGCDVYVDNVMRGVSEETRGKLLIGCLSAGPHSVRVTKMGYGVYKIDLVLEGGQQADLQVQLAARATVAMPVVPAGTPGGPSAEPMTGRMAGGDEAATALLGQDSLRNAIDAAPVAAPLVAPMIEEAVETRNLAAPKPATIAATAAAGSPRRSATAVVTPVVTSAPPSAAGKPGRGKWLAAAASILLLGVLAAGAAMMMKGRSRSVAQPDTSSSPVVQQAAAPAEKSELTAAVSPAPGATPKPENPDAAKVAAEKEAAEKEQLEKAKEQIRKDKEQLAAAQTPAPIPSPAQVAKAPEPPPAPVVTTPPPQEATPAAGQACLQVDLVGVALPVSGYRVVGIDAASRPATRIQSGVGPKGHWRQCGFTVGHQVELRLWNGGNMIGVKFIQISEGVNRAQFSVDGSAAGTAPATGDQTGPGRRRRPL